MAIGTASGGSGYSITTQKIWEPRSDDDCRERGYANVDETLIALMTCGNVLEFDSGSLRATAPSGEDLWEWEFGAEHEASRSRWTPSSRSRRWSSRPGSAR